MSAQAVSVGGLSLKNPVLVASGTFGYGREFAPLFDLSRLGGIMVKGVSVTPWAGNAGVRVAETESGMLNAIGLQNPGLQHFLDVDWPWLRRFDTAVVVNVVGHSVAEYVAVTEAVTAAGVGAVELNVSCPNIADGLVFGTDERALFGLVSAVRKVTALPLIVKLSPNTSGPLPYARAAVEAGADALSLINTVLGVAIDRNSGQTVLGNRTGGLSGPAIRPIALRFVLEVAAALPVDLIGMGGIATAQDAVSFLQAGAGAVAVGTALFRDPWTALRIIDELPAALSTAGYQTVDEAVGRAVRQERERRDGRGRS